MKKQNLLMWLAIIAGLWTTGQPLQAKVINQFPYVNSFETESDLDGWTLSDVTRPSGTAYDGSYYLYFTRSGYLITPELNLASLQNPCVSFLSTGASNYYISISFNGIDFINYVVGSNNFTIPQTTKYLKIQEGYGYIVDKFTIKESPVVSTYPYVNSFETESDLDGWMLSDVTRSSRTGSDGSYLLYFRTSSGYLITPELNLSALQNPHVSFLRNESNSYHDTIYISSNGIDFTEYSIHSNNFAVNLAIPKTTKYLKIKGNSGCIIDKFTIKESPVISTYPYVNSFETVEDWEGWTISDVVRSKGTSYDGSYYANFASGGYLITPELNLASLQNPHVSFLSNLSNRGSYTDTIYISTNGTDFVKHIVNTSAFTIPKTTKHLKIKGSLSIDKFTIQESPVISTFPYVNSFETEEDWTGWTISDVVRLKGTGYDGSYYASFTSGGYLITPELNLSSLQNPHVSFLSNLSSSTPDTVYISVNGTDFSEYVVNTDNFAIPKTTQYIKIKCTTSFLFDRLVIQESPVISVIPHLNPSFDTQESVYGWTLNGAYCDFSNNRKNITFLSGGEAVSPRLELMAKTRVIIGSTSNNISNTLFYYSTDGEMFLPLGLSTSPTSSYHLYADIPANARYIKLKDNNDYGSVLSYFKMEYPVEGKYYSTLNFGGLQWIADGDNALRLETISETHYTHRANIIFTFPKGTTSYKITYTLSGMDKDKLGSSMATEDGTYTLSGEGSSANFYVSPKTTDALQSLPDLRISDIKTQLSTVPVPSLDNLYDIDGDGTKELVLKPVYNKTPVVTYHINENVFAMGDTVLNISDTYANVTVLNANNDDKADFVIGRSTNANMYIASPEGYRIVEKIMPTDWDVNADGRPDFYFETDYDENGNQLAGTERYIQHQQLDGNFLKSRIEFVDNQEFRGAAQEFIRKNSYDSFQMFADIAINGTPVLSNLTREIDFNKDGLPDLLSDNGVLLNLGNNKFAFAEAPAGQIFVKDLNGDFLSDMILYDEEAQTVTSRIYLGNGEIKEQVVLKNFKISGIWCYDFDRDGDVDILIPLNYQSTIGYAFLVFCENQGEGKFKIHENYYEDKWNFLHCADVDNDGYYDLIAGNEGTTNQSDTIKYYLFTGKDKFTYNEPVYLVSSPFRNYPTIYSYLQDFDNDGVFELAICNNSSYSSGSTYIYNFENVPANQRPNKPAAPTFALNSETGKLKISWNMGSDAETSAVDLTYSLRIGSAPGKSDIWFPYANPDGSRITFTPGNMGSNPDKIVDVSGWQPGNYYISIQTVDPMYSGSAFSDEVVYTHEALTPKFTLSDSRIFTVDTLTVSLAGNKLAGYTYNWDIPDGQIIEETDCSLKVVFSQGGEKTIALQVTGANGEALPAYEQQISVLPNKLVKNSPYFGSFSFLDFDGDGVLDATGVNGLHSNNGQGIFTKIPKLYNSDLQTTSSAVGVLDLNMDGLPDMLARTNKGNTLINEGDFAFDVRNENFTWNGSYYTSGIRDVHTKNLYDFNNDGWTDYLDTGNDRYLFKNKGGNYEFEKTILSSGTCYDWNNDGLWDVIHNTSDTKLTVYIYKGNFEFETTEVDLSHLSNLYSSYSFADIKDMNNDAYPDLIFRKQYRRYVAGMLYAYTYNYYVAFGNKENRYENPVEVISDADDIAAIQDMDNNGFLDIILSPTDLPTHSIVYFYPGGEVKVIRDANRESLYLPSNSSFYSDLNGDNIPDFSTEVSFQTKIRNTPPQAPANVRACQTNAGLLIEWDAAQDAETPYVQMRYNVSVKKRGANVGDENAFIVSPLNGLEDEAATVPELAYRTATRMEIPMERIPAGSYEIQVQSIDLWNAHSLLSAPFTIETSTQLSVQAPSNACIDVPVAITARSSEPINGGALLWDWDGGTVVSGSDAGPYQVKWSTPGVKTIKASINGTPVSTAIMVGQGEFYDLTFNLPYTVLADVAVAFTLPEVLMNPAIAFHFNTSDKKISISRRTGTRECKVVFSESGGSSQWIELQIETEGCASPVYRQSVTVKSGIATPKISLVNIDEATGKNRIIWDKYNVNLSSEVTEMLIYKEGSRYNQFNLIGRATPGSGEFIDLMSNPQITTSRYLIAYNTIYSAQSNQSVPHRSTHLMLNRGMANSINLYWTPYEGGIIESYRIYRGETPETLSLLVEIPGSANSYTDLMPPEGLFYYAIEYDQVYNTQWEMENTISQSSTFRASQTDTQLISGRSNAVSVVNAQNITMVQSINIMVMEETPTLNKEQPELHLYTEIFPVTADYKVVNWLIVSGAEYAYITSQGTLAAIRNTQGGTVTVRAAAVDGSNITATRSFTVEAFEDGTAIVQPEIIPEISFKIYPNPVSEGFFVSGIHEKATLRLINLSGNVIVSKPVNNGEYVPVSSLAAGIYIVRLQTGNGTMEKKLIKR